MAGGTITLNSTRSILEGRINWSSSSNGSSANSSNVWAEIQVRRNDGYTTKGTWTGNLEIGGDNRSYSVSTTVGSDWVTLLSFSITRWHNADGYGDCYIGGTTYGPSGTSMAGYYTSGGNTVTLDRIARYLSINSFNVKSKAINSAVIAWSVSDARDNTQYSLNSGAWTGSATYGESVAGDNKSGTFNIPNLSPYTTYTLKIRCRRSDSGLWTESGTITFATYDIARISSANDFNLGDSTSITITNPASATTSLAIKVGDVTIKTIKMSTGKNDINFTDNEIDSIYKQFTSENMLTVTYELMTNNNSNWKSTKAVKCTLTGNVKTAHIGKDGQAKRAKVFVCVNGEIKRAVMWVGVNGVAKRCI